MYILRTCDTLQVELVKKLRHEDEEFWSVLTLSRLFKVKKGVIRQELVVSCAVYNYILHVSENVFVWQ